MIDAAEGLLQTRGVPRESIHCDRFTTQHEAPAASAISVQPNVSQRHDQ